MDDYYALYVAEDRGRQAVGFLRQALAVLRPEDAVYAQVALALSAAEYAWQRARVQLAEATNEPIDVALDTAVESARW